MTYTNSEEYAARAAHLGERIRTMFGKEAWVNLASNGCDFDVELSDVDRPTFTFQTLQSLAEEFGTTNINFMYEKGRYYSPETSSDPDTVRVQVIGATRGLDPTK